MCDCVNTRKLLIDAKVNDMLGLKLVSDKTISKFGYVPCGLGIGGGDYLKMAVCLECGKVQNMPKLSDEEIEEAMDSM